MFLKVVHYSAKVCRITLGFYEIRLKTFCRISWHILAELYLPNFILPNIIKLFAEKSICRKLFQPNWNVPIYFYHLKLYKLHCLASSQRKKLNTVWLSVSFFQSQTHPTRTLTLTSFSIDQLSILKFTPIIIREFFIIFQYISNKNEI